MKDEGARILRRVARETLAGQRPALKALTQRNAKFAKEYKKSTKIGCCLPLRSFFILPPSSLLLRPLDFPFMTADTAATDCHSARWVMATKQSGLSARFEEFKDTWRTLSPYERIEQVIALVLTYLIAVIVLIATWDLAKEVFLLAWHGLLDPLDHRMFQVIFGQIMTLLIALEFKHSIIKVVAHRESIIQVKTVLLIALLAISRKFIILEPNQYSAQIILGLAAVVIALGVTYWLIRDRDAKA